MIKAYHVVDSSRALRVILKQGELLPATLRYSALSIKRKCINNLNCDPELDSRVIRVLKNLMDALVSDVREFQRLQGYRPAGDKKMKGALGCFDLLAGDGNLVFLSPGRLEDMGPSHFVFDAEDLIHRGARIRHQDFITMYKAGIKDAVMKAKSDQDAVAMIVDTILDIQKQELSGDEAISFVRKERYRFGPVGGWMAELIWEGPLSTDLALEVWDNEVEI